MKTILKTTLFQLIFCMICFSFVNTQAKTTCPVIPIVPKNKISFTFSPEYAYRTVVAHDNSISNFWSDEKPFPSFYTGFAFLHTFKKKFELDLGLNYSLKGFLIPNVSMTTPENPDASDPNNIYNAKYKFHFIDFPLKFNTFFKLKTLNCYVSAGPVGNILLNDDATLIKKNDQNVSQNFEMDLKSNDFTLSGYLGLGISHILSNRFILRTDIHLQHQLFVSNNPPPIERKLYNSGFGISLVYCLKKIESKTTGTNF